METAQLLAKDLGVELEIVHGHGCQPHPLSGDQSRRPDHGDLRDLARAREVGVVLDALRRDRFGPDGARRAGGIKSYADLSGKKVAVARGSFTEQALAREAPKDVQIVRFDDDAAATRPWWPGRSTAYGTAMPIAATLIKRFPDKQLEIKLQMLTAWYGIGMKRGDADLLQWVNILRVLPPARTAISAASTRSGSAAAAAGADALTTGSRNVHIRSAARTISIASASRPGAGRRAPRAARRRS